MVSSKAATDCQPVFGASKEANEGVSSMGPHSPPVATAATARKTHSSVWHLSLQLGSVDLCSHKALQPSGERKEQ